VAGHGRDVLPRRAPPTAVDVDVYAAQDATLAFYWNLDLYAYDAPSARAAHAIGTYHAQAGWHRVHLDVPAGVTRTGLNQLGFRTSAFQPTVLCPASLSDATCAQSLPLAATLDRAIPYVAPAVVRDERAQSPAPQNVSVFVGAVQFTYAR